MLPKIVQSIHLYENIEFRLSLSSDLGNALSIVVLSSPEMRSSFNRLLTALAIFDLIYLFVSVMVFGLPKLSVSYALNVLPRVMPIA